MKTNENVVYRCVAGEHILIPVGGEALSSNGLFVLTETGALTWNMLSEGKSVQEITEKICEEFDAEASVVLEDVNALIQKLTEAGLIIE